MTTSSLAALNSIRPASVAYSKGQGNLGARRFNLFKGGDKGAITGVAAINTHCSLYFSMCGELYTPTVKPDNRRIFSSMAQVVPLPFVPATVTILLLA